jgi:CubicO group peptidase (beta-lactamase class C family)
MLIAGMNALKDAIAFAKAAESKWPKSMYMPDGQFVMTYDSGEKAPDNEVLGPVTPRGGHAGIVYRGGKILAEWGDVTRPDMTFSVAKSYLALLAGLALGDGLIRNLDDKAGDYALDDCFKSAQNQDITWRHLLTQTSEWEGTMFGKEDLERFVSQATWVAVNEYEWQMVQQKRHAGLDRGRCGRGP